MIMKVKVQKDGQIRLPSEILQALKIENGEWLTLKIEDGHILLQPIGATEKTLTLTADHPIWELVGKWASGERNVSSDKYRHLAEAYEPNQ